MLSISDNYQAAVIIIAFNSTSKNIFMTLYMTLLLPAGGLYVRLYDDSDLKTYPLMRWLGPDVFAAVRPTGFYLLDFLCFNIQFYLTGRSKAVLLLWKICVISVMCLSCFRVCSLLPYGHMLRKG